MVSAGAIPPISARRDKRTGFSQEAYELLIVRYAERERMRTAVRYSGIMAPHFMAMLTVRAIEG